MATAELFGDVPLAITSTVGPPIGASIPGSTQTYEMTLPSANTRTSVFFPPQPKNGELTAYWGNQLKGAVRWFRAVVSGETHSAILNSNISNSSFAWDRLSIELMRIASLGPNWDGEGAEAVPQSAVVTTAELLFLARTVSRRPTVAQSSFPTLMPAVDGGVTFKWTRAGKELKCTVLDGTVEVVRWKSPDGYESDGMWEIPVSKVAEHFEWLVQE